MRTGSRSKPTFRLGRSNGIVKTKEFIRFVEFMAREVGFEIESDDIEFVREKADGTHRIGLRRGGGGGESVHGIHPFFINTDGTVHAGTVNGVIPTLGGDEIGEDGNSLTLSGSYYVYIRVKFDLTFGAGLFLESYDLSTSSPVTIQTSSTPLLDSNTSSTMTTYRLIAHIVSGDVQREQPTFESMTVVVCDQSTGAEGGEKNAGDLDMKLCPVNLDEEGLVVNVGPAAITSPRCVAGCCQRTSRLQIRSRTAYGAAALCAAFVDVAADPTLYYTRLNVTETIKSFKIVTGPDEVVRECVLAKSYESGDAAVKHWSDPSYILNCNGSTPTTEPSPADCEDHIYDPPTDYAQSETESTYSGDTGRPDNVKDAALGALAWSDWSDWSDLVEIDVDMGTSAGGFFELPLAGSGVSAGSIPGASIAAQVNRLESELKVVGSFPLYVAISTGTGGIGTLPVIGHTLAAGETLMFSSDLPSFDPSWTPTASYLRCVCPTKYAP